MRSILNAESDLREIEYLLNHDPIKEMDSILEDSVDENSLDGYLVDTFSDYLWEDFPIPSLTPTSLIPYQNLQRFINLVITMRYKDKVGKQIPEWMISKEMKNMEHYRMYAESVAESRSRGKYGLGLQALALKRLKDDGKIKKPRSDKEIPEVEITNDEEVEITNVVILVNVNEEEEEITDEVFLSRKSFETLVDHLQEVMVESLPTMVDTNIKEQVKKPTESTQGTHRTLSAPNSPTHKKDTAESISLAEHKSREKQEARENVELVNKHLASKEIEKIIEGSENVIDDSLPPRNDEPQIPGTRLEPRSDKESLEVEITNDEEVKITNVVIPVNVSEEEDEITDEVYELKRKEKAKNVEESRSTPFPTPIRSPRTHTNLKGSSGPEKIVLSLHKFPAIIFKDNDIEERTSRWVNKCVKKFNPYDRYGVELWKNPHAKIFYIKKQKEPGKPKEVVYSNLKIIQVIKTYWELGHEHKFSTEIVARRANECIMSITKPDYKNLNKNDIEDMYLLIMNGKVPDYAETGLLWSLSVFIRSSMIWERVHDLKLRIESYQQKVNLTAPITYFLGVEKHKMFSIIYEPVHGIIYKNSKKEKRVMRHSEIHKFCDATLNRVLEGLKSYNNDVKYGYVQRELTNDEVEYLKLFEEEIEVRLKYRYQMRRWEIY
ncbi:hypothetical protein Tco_0104781 [Tanacetum coccineum]